MKARGKKRLTTFIICLLACGLIAGCAGSSKSPSGQESATPEPTPETTPAATLTPSAAPAPSATPAEPSPSETPATPTPAPKEMVKVKGLYLTGWTAGDKGKLQKYVELANTTEINAYVIDIKNDDGEVSYESAVPEVISAGSWVKKFDPEYVIKTLHDNNIHVIGRIVCFRDPIYSKKNPDRAVKHTDGGLWKEEKKDKDITWLNPCDKSNWDYILDIAEEAVAKGFDEIQFDYVRFPYGDRSKMDFGMTGFVKVDVINEFLSCARKRMPDVVLSADVFGIICESPGDTEDIGQNLETIGMELDYVSPMTYPSLYALGQIVNGVKFPKPDLEPYSVVYNSLVKAKNRLSVVNGYRADIRPFIQAYTASWLKQGTYQKYGPEQYRQQIKAVYDAGYEQWIFWDANNKYDFSAFEKE